MQLPASKVVFDQNEIDAAIGRIATELNARCVGAEWIVVCVLNGALIFTGELVRRLTFPLRLESIRVSRYHETTTGKDLKWHARTDIDLSGKRVLLVDDIFDEGKTLAAIAEDLKLQGASEVLSVVLLEKLHTRKVGDFRPDFVGLECSDAYVFGYGMDYEGQLRHLPEIRQLAGES